MMGIGVVRWMCLADDSQRGDYPKEQGLVFFLQSAWIEPGVSLVIECSRDRRCKDVTTLAPKWVSHNEVVVNKSYRTIA